MAEKFEPKVSVGHSNIPYVLGLIGGAVTVLIAILSIALMISNVDSTLLIMNIIGIISGGLVIYGTILLKVEDKFKTGSVLMITFSILALLALQGLIVGPILSLIGGILTHIRKMI